MSRHTGYQDMSEAGAFRTTAANVEALNAATANTPRGDADARVLGNHEGPHDFDIQA
jgi:5-methyltetrahydropteroyltriglutamate--homocysteine methyltransferase